MIESEIDPNIEIRTETETKTDAAPSPANSKAKSEQKKVVLLLDLESNEKLESIRDLLNARSKRKWQLQDVASEILQLALKSDISQELVDENTTMEWRVEEALSDPQRRDAVMKALGLIEKSEKLVSKKSRRGKETSEKDFIENESGTSN